MKKIALVLFIALFFVSCTNEEEKMQKVIRDYLYTTLDDFKSYEPISFSPSDSCFSDWTMDPMLPKIEADFAKMSNLSDSITKVMKWNASRGYSLDDMTDEINLLLISTFYTTVTYQSKKDSIKDHYVSEFLGYGINHVFRTNNRLGVSERLNLQFILDPSKSSVIMIRDIDAGEEITAHHKILNKDELEARIIQERLDKNPGIKERSQAFLEENKKKEGVHVTGSGLQYRVIEEGKGRHPTPESEVTCNYVIRSIDGEILDRTKDKPLEMPLKYLVKGFKEALILMKPGAKFEFFVPAELAYGEKGNDLIPPYAATIFEIELISIK